MSSYLGLLFKRDMGLEILRLVDTRTYLLFAFLVKRCDGQLYRANKHRERACSNLTISESTYYRKLKKLVEIGLLVKDGPADYKVNNGLVKIMYEMDEEMEKQRKR